MGSDSQGVAEMMKFMKDSGFTCTEEWLEACVEWIKDNYSNSQVTSAFMKKELYGQWLDANLMEMESSCLPPNLSGQRVTQLTGRYGLQVNSIEDIGESSYSQYNKLKQRENENTNVSASDSTQMMQSWQPKPRRCLYLTMTDGSQKVFGMEVLSNSSLSLAIKPGTKVTITGPVECRRAVLLLKPSHIKVLGGEVDSLMSENSLEKVLSRNLNGPHQTGQRDTTHDESTVIVPNNSSLPTQPAYLNEFDLDGDDDIFMEIDETLLMGQTQSSSTTGQTGL